MHGTRPSDNETPLCILSDNELAILQTKCDSIFTVAHPIRREREVHYTLTGGRIPTGGAVEGPFAIIAPAADLVKVEGVTLVGDVDFGTFALLALVLKDDDFDNSGSLDVDSLFERCQSVRSNIAASDTNKHFDTVGFVYGFGAVRSYRSNDGVTIAQYVPTDCSTEKLRLAEAVEAELVGSIEKAERTIRRFMGSSPVAECATLLKGALHAANDAGLKRTIHLKGRTNFTTMFNCINASTRIQHTERDWSYTIITVPQQDWSGKGDGHLQFFFHLTGGQEGVICADMKPGATLFYHGFFITHQQLHRNGKFNESDGPCCVNHSAYANRCLCNYTNRTLGRKNATIQRRNI